MYVHMYSILLFAESRRGGAIEVSQQARSHPLFPLLDFIARGVHSQGQKIVAIEAKQGKLEADMAVVKHIQEELMQLMQTTAKHSFNLKDQGFEVYLNHVKLTYYLHSHCNSVKFTVS